MITNLKYLLCLSVLFSINISKAQLLDSLEAYIKTRPTIDARLESRNSFIKYGRAKISGVRLGVTYRKKLRLGIGYSWLDSEVYTPRLITDPTGNQVYVDNYLNFGYVAYYADFVFHKTKRWQLSVPLQLGTGLSWFNSYYNYQPYTSKKYFLLLYEPGISVQFKVFKWFGMSVIVQFELGKENIIEGYFNNINIIFLLNLVEN
jgi:hypothetical protein